MTCPVCRTENPLGAHFCFHCGTRISVACPTCGFGNVLAARFCNQCGSRLTPAVADGQLVPVSRDGTSAKPIEPALLPPSDEERRTVTVLFADLVGFTSMADSIDPEQAREISAITLGRLAREISRFGGTIDKYIGDAVLAIFGAPVAHEDDAERAVGSALAMQRAVVELQSGLVARGDVGSQSTTDAVLRLRIGINTGLVVVGTRTLGGHTEYTAIGDAVNVASRLQTTAQPGTIVVGQSTYRLARRRFSFAPLDPLVLRGKSRPVAAYRVLGPLRAEAGQPALEPAARHRLVGREQELSSLYYCLEELQRGRGQIAFVVGEPGLGKTRLLTELRGDFRDVGSRWLAARALSYRQHTSYSLLQDVVRELTRLPAESGDLAVPPDLVRLLSEGWEAPSQAASTSSEQPLAGLASSRSFARQSGEAHTGLALTLSAWLGSFASSRGLVLAIDDLQWADPASINLLENVLTLADDAAVAFLFLLRPERESRAWQLREYAARHFPHRFTEVTLAPLTDSESRQLVAALVGRPLEPSRLEQRILSRTEGNPLFIEAVVEDLLERGAFRSAPGEWDDESFAGVAVPENLQSAILARFDRLNDVVRQVLQTAAVIGRDFSYQLLERMQHGDPGLGAAIEAAQQHDFIVEIESGPQREYAFRHALVQEAIYQTLLVRRRRELHAAALAALEDLYADRLDAVSADLVLHAAEAEAFEPLLCYAERAGDGAVAAGAVRQALQYYSLALRACDNLAASGLSIQPGRAAELLEKRGDLELQLGYDDAATASFQAALAQRDASAEQDADAARLNLKLARLALLSRDIALAERLLRSARQLLPADHPDQSIAAAVQSQVSVSRADYAKGAAAAQRALALAQEGADFQNVSEAYGVLTQAPLAGQSGIDLSRTARDWISAARAHGDEAALFAALTTSVVNQLWVAGTVDQRTLDSAREAVRIAERFGDPEGARDAHALVGACYLLQGDWGAAEAELLREPRRGAAKRGAELAAFWGGMLRTGQGHLEAGRSMFASALMPDGFSHARIWLQQGLAWNRWLAADLPAARAALESGGEAARQLRCLPCGTYFSGVAAELWAALGERDLSEQLLGEAQRGARILGRAPSSLAADRATATLLAQQGLARQAVSRLTSALRRARAIGQPFEIGLTALQLGEVLLVVGPGERDRARKQTTRALLEFESLGAEPYAARARACLDYLAVA